VKMVCKQGGKVTLVMTKKIDNTFVTLPAKAHPDGCQKLFFDRGEGGTATVND